jgi:putative SOS response-associated peptidase YedK
MCESFCLAYPRSGLINLSHVATMPEIEPRYNLTPSTDILIIRDRVNSQARSMMLPGLISHGISKSLAIKPMFKHAFCCQRCLIPAAGFYEWKFLARGKAKQPFYVSAIRVSSVVVILL